MSKDIVPKKDLWDLVYRLTKSGVASIPIVGGPIAEAIGYFLVSPYEKRQGEFFIMLANGLAELKTKCGLDLEEALNREKVKTTLIQAYLIWLRSHQKAKKDALLNVIFNSMTSDDSDEDLETIFLHYIDFLTPSHLELLEFLFMNEIDRKGGNWATSLDAKIHKAIASVNSKFRDIGYFNIIIKDLIDRQLIDRMSKNVPEDSYFSSVVTPMGESFLNYIKFPKV